MHLCRLVFSLLNFFFDSFFLLYNSLLKRCKGGSQCLVPNSYSDGGKKQQRGNSQHEYTFRRVEVDLAT